MRLGTHHYVILSLIILCAALNYAIFFRGENSDAVVLNNQELITTETNINQITEEPTTTSTSSTSTTARTDWKPVTILHFGDTMFDRNVRKRMALGVDLFSSLHQLNITPDYDIRILNLEGPIIEIDRSKCQQKAYNFQFAEDTGMLLKNNGITSVTIANNHIYDCYREGLDSTINHLKESNIGIIGNPKLEESFELITTKEGTRVALVGIDATINTVNKPKLSKLLNELDKTNDVVIISAHFGEEYFERATLEQKSLAHFFIENGADAVIGHHPHYIENMEVYKNKPIFYSLGNFIFDQIGEKENQGFAVGLKLSPEWTDVMLFPYDILSSVPTFKSMENANEWCRNYYGVMPYVTGEGCSARITK